MWALKIWESSSGIELKKVVDKQQKMKWESKNKWIWSYETLINRTVFIINYLILFDLLINFINQEIKSK